MASPINNILHPLPVVKETPSRSTGVNMSGRRETSSSKQIAVRACVACRQMKMKCEGAEFPPCKRCQKVGRECVPQSGGRLKGPQEIHEPPRPSTIGPYPGNPNTGSVSISSSRSNETHQTILESPRVAPIHHSQFVVNQFNDSHSQSLSELPSIYSTPPVHTVSEQLSPKPTPSLYRKRKRETDPLSRGNNSTSPCSWSQGDAILSKEEMKDMIQVFRQRHLPFIPALYYEDYDNPDQLIENELPFVYCICYVAAKYLPGGKEIREQLLPGISQLPRGIFAPSHEGQIDDWMILKSLSVLYAYSDLTSPSQTAKTVAEQDIGYWPLKYAIEVLALRLSLHRSIQDLRSELQASLVPAPGITHNFKRYNVWLWLFNMAHYCSIVCGTPPSIRIDSAIRSSGSVVDRMGQGPYLSTLFGIAELYVIWEKASVKLPQIGEWWCLPDPAEVVDENSVGAMIVETDHALALWRARWHDFLKRDDHGAFLEYHGRFTQFCITNYAVKCVRSSPQGLTPLQTEQIAKCVACANHVIDWPLNRAPVQKDKLRYVDDSACIMITFCCLFILSTCQKFTSCIPDISDCLDNVTEAAQLMVDLAINSDEKPYIQGAFILRRAEALKIALENVRQEKSQANLLISSDSCEHSLPLDTTLTFDGLEDWLQDDENFIGIDWFYHFPKLLPDIQDGGVF